MGKQELLRVPIIVLIGLMYGSAFLGQIIGILADAKNTLTHIIDRAREYAATNAQHVNKFYRFEPQELTYVLVQLKAQRIAWERRVSWFAGAIEKVGILGSIPGFAAFIIMARKEGASSPWIQQMANVLIYGTPFLYALSFWSYQQMTKLDRAIMLLEMVIESKKSEHPLIEPWYSVSSKNGQKGPYILSSKR